MTFRVSYKGITRFCGNLFSVSEFLKNQWGSTQLASEIGVKVEPVTAIA